MLTALIIATTATALILTIAVITVLTGWFPRDRAELVARLWVP